MTEVKQNNGKKTSSANCKKNDTYNQNRMLSFAKHIVEHIGVCYSGFFTWCTSAFDLESKYGASVCQDY